MIAAITISILGLIVGALFGTPNCLQNQRRSGSIQGTRTTTAATAAGTGTAAATSVTINTLRGQQGVINNNNSKKKHQHHQKQKFISSKEHQVTVVVSNKRKNDFNINKPDHSVPVSFRVLI